MTKDNHRSTAIYPWAAKHGGDVYAIGQKPKGSPVPGMDLGIVQAITPKLERLPDSRGGGDGISICVVRVLCDHGCIDLPMAETKLWLYDKLPPALEPKKIIQAPALDDVEYTGPRRVQ